MDQTVKEVLAQSLNSQNQQDKEQLITSSELPADKIILDALSSKKIFDADPVELVDIISVSVARAFADTGKRNDQNLNEQIDYIIQSLPGSLKRLFPSMRINEIPIAINRGIYKEFGEYYGVNVAEIVRFCRTHLESTERVNAAKQILKPIQTPQLAPSKESLFYLYKNNLLDAFEKNKVGGNYESNGPGLYDFCNKLGLIIFSTKEKYDIMQDAAHAVIKDQHMALIVIVEDFKRRPLQKIIDVISEHLNNAGPLTEGIKPLIISKSKFLTLKAFFSDIDMSELNLSEIVDNKKDLFINEA